MKKLIQYIPLILLITLAHSPLLWSQQTPNCDDQIGQPITDDMFSTEVISPCDPTDGNIIFSYDDFISNTSGTDIIFGNTICNLTFSPNNSCNEVTTAILSTVYGDLTIEELMDCFDVLCSPQMDMAQDNFDELQSAFATAANGEGVDIDAIIQEVEDEEGEETSQEEIETYLEIGDGELDNLAENLATGMSGLADIQTIVENALGISDDCAGGSVWDDLIDPSDDPIPKTGNSSGGKSFIRKMEEKVEQMALEYFMANNSDLGKDPNWFLGEVEGLGGAASGTKMPSPSATSTINSVSSGVNLYNGSASFSLPLDNISTKDVGVPIAVNSQPGGLKVDDMESLMGSNMNLSAGGKVTRIVKGLPDEFYGDINGYAYGMKRGIKPVSEFLGVDVGVDIKKSMPKFIKKIVCRIIQYLIEELFDQNISGLCGDISNIVSDIGTNLEADPVTDVSLPPPSQLVERVKEKYGIRELSAGPNVKLDFSWKPLEFNYVNLDVVIIIPLFGAIDLVIIPKFRAGVKIVEVPSPVLVNKTGIGYNHLTNASIMDDLGLSPLNINDFYGLSNEEKLQIFNKKQSTKKREDFEFFNPKANYFLEIMEDFAQLFNSNNDEPYPVHNTEQLDLEPDEYYYEFGNYSGKFYFQPDGEIVLVPYQDFEISTVKVLGKITSFSFLTPEGHKYTFAKPATSKYDHYSLPSSFRYEEIGTSRENFKKPVMAKVEYPTYKFWMGIPLFMEVKKDYMTNYYVEEGMTYTSAWHMTSVRSLTSQEEVTVLYEDNDLQLHYNEGKNWRYSFPDFEVQNSQFRANIDPDAPIHFKPTQWINGFSELTYSLSEVFVTEPIVKEINNNRGKKAIFTYGLDNASLPGGKLCTRIEVQKNNNFFKAWEFDYSSSAGTETTTTCEGTQPGEDGSVSPAYANDSEYKLDFDQSEKDANDKFFYKFPVAVDILNGCIRFEIPIKLKFDIDDKAPNGYYYMDAVSEFGSLMQLKTVLDIRDDNEQNRFNAEFARNFLQNVNEIDGASEAHNIAKVNYQGDVAELPKRFSIHQDIWGYYNGISTSMSPFIQEDYRYPDFHTSTPYHNTAHFAFKHPSVSDEDFDAGRNWAASAGNATIGQIESIDLETGAFFQYEYDMHEYPLYTVANGANYEHINNIINGQSGGLRIKSFTKGSGNGPTQKTTYRYRNPSVVNLPMFMDYRGFSFVFLNKYKNKERKITTSWKPTNIWQMNKSGYVGYGKVDELFDENLDGVFDNGTVIHQFTNPLMKDKTYELVEPASQTLYVRYNRIFKWGANNNIQTLNTQNANSFDHHIKPKIVRDWRYGLEYKTKVLGEDGTLLQKTDTDYNFPTMAPSLKYPLSDMRQHLHYGSYHDFVDEGNLYTQIVDVGTRCMPHRFAQIIRFIVKHIITEHPYRHIKKWFPHSEIVLESEKVETVNSVTTNYYVDGNNKVTTSYTYYNNPERKIKEVTQAFSNGQSSGTKYVYADNLYLNNSNYPFIEQAIMGTMDQQLNYELPVVKVSKLNGTPVNGSATNFYEEGGRYLPKTIWGVREGAFALTGIFDAYNDDGMVTNYRLAKYGTSTNANDYDFFPEFVLTWNSNLLQRTRTFGNFTTENTYDEDEDNLCLPKSSIDANGLITRYSFDDRRRLESIISPGELQTQTFTYNMNPLSTTTTTTFSDDTPTQEQVENNDGWGNFLSLVRHDGATLSAQSYDNLFRPVNESKLGSGTTQYTYETSPLSRVVEIQDAVGNISRMLYLGPNTNPDYSDLFTFSGIQSTDPNNHISYGWQDAFGKPALRISGEGGITQTKYDSQGRVEQITNPIDEIYEYTYNTMGQLATKLIPNRGTESYWYDRSMRMVAKSDPLSTMVMDYDDSYRLSRAGLASTSSFGDPATTVLEEEFVNDFMDDILLANTYEGGKTWLENTTEGILVGNAVDGNKFSVFGRDDYGRITSTNIQYSNGNSINEVINILNAANISREVSSTITGPDGARSMTYNFGIDDVLRQTTTELTYGGQTRLLEKLNYNGLDQVELKQIGGTDNGFLQNVDFAYDGAGKILKINEPLETGCLVSKEVCQLYWGNVEEEVALETEDCGKFTGIKLDGEVFTSSSPISLSNTEAIAAFVDEQISESGKIGATEVFYESYFGIDEDFHISIMQTNVQTAELIFENNNCQYTLSTKECCEIIIVEPSGDFPVAGGPENPDLFYESITYNGLDISMIEMIGSCSAGMIENRYTYDADHRLTNVQNTLYTPQIIGDAFSSSYTYDPAGNIQSLKRNGWVPQDEEFRMIDDLAYTYKEINDKTTSKLMMVEDQLAGIDDLAQPGGFGSNFTASEYDYDGNGNLNYDGGKLLTNIAYNLLNLPSSVTHQTDGAMTYEYAFGGEKIKKISPEGEREYVGGMEYQDGALEFFQIPNGRVIEKEGTQYFQYQLTDHLGNIVVVFEDKNEDGIISLEEETEDEEDREVLQRNHYYSFGLRVDAPHFLTIDKPRADYLYNGKELDEELDLNWLNYGLRMYDPAIGRFPSVDPIADEFAWVSGFNYAENRPIDGIDLWGLQYININTFAKELGLNPSIAKAKFKEYLIDYDGGQYINLGRHVNNSEGDRITEWIFEDIPPVIAASENVKYTDAGDCFAACNATVAKKGVSPKGYWQGKQTFLEEGVKGTLRVSEQSKSEALDIIHSELEAGNPVIVGVTDRPGSRGNNSDQTTDHFVVIVGRGVDENGTEFFRFYDNTGTPESVKTDASNKFILNSDGVLEFDSGNYRNNYTVSQVRGNNQKNKTD